MFMCIELMAQCGEPYIRGLLELFQRCLGAVVRLYRDDCGSRGGCGWFRNYHRYLRNRETLDVDDASVLKL